MRKTVLLLALVSGLAHAEFRDGNKLLAEMNSELHDRMYSLGYVVGVIDALSNVTICAPANLTAGQARDMVKLYLENNPSIRHYSADSIVNRVMSNVWPCKKGSNL